MARILLKKNQGYPKMVDDLNSLKIQLDKAQTKYNIASNANDKTKTKAVVEDLTSRISIMEKDVAAANKEIDRAFDAYGKLLEL